MYHVKMSENHVNLDRTIVFTDLRLKGRWKMLETKKRKEILTRSK